MKRKKEMELARQEGLYYCGTHVLDQEFNYRDGSGPDYEKGGADNLSGENAHNAQHLGATVLASKFAANTRRGVQHKSDPTSLQMPKLLKPEEPDFSSDPEDS